MVFEVPEAIRLPEVINGSEQVGNGLPALPGGPMFLQQQVAEVLFEAIDRGQRVAWPNHLRRPRNGWAVASHFRSGLHLPGLRFRKPSPLKREAGPLLSWQPNFHRSCTRHRQKGTDFPVQTTVEILAGSSSFIGQPNINLFIMLSKDN